jgi:hypothetical protein
MLLLRDPVSFSQYFASPEDKRDTLEILGFEESDFLLAGGRIDLERLRANPPPGSSRSSPALSSYKDSQDLPFTPFTSYYLAGPPVSDDGGLSDDFIDDEASEGDTSSGESSYVWSSIDSEPVPDALCYEPPASDSSPEASSEEDA